MHIECHYRLLKKEGMNSYRVTKVIVSIETDYEDEDDLTLAEIKCPCTPWLPYQEAKEIMMILAKS